MTPARFAAKVEWEGGILEALDYGLAPADVTEGPLRDLWSKLSSLYRQMQPILAEAQRALDDTTGQHDHADENCACGCRDGDDDG